MPRSTLTNLQIRQAILRLNSGARIPANATKAQLLNLHRDLANRARQRSEEAKQPPPARDPANYYYRLPDAALNSIAHARDVQLLPQMRREQLYELDKVMPEWATAVREAGPIHAWTRFGTAEFYLLAALNEIPLPDAAPDGAFFRAWIAGHRWSARSVDSIDKRPLREGGPAATLAECQRQIDEGRVPQLGARHPFYPHLADAPRLASLLVEYPRRVEWEAFDVLAAIPHKTLCQIAISRGCPAADAAFRETIDLLIKLATGCWPSASERQSEIAARYAKISAAPAQCRELLCRLYGLESEACAEYARRSPVSALEAHIYALATESQAVVDALGMLVPAGRDPQAYAASNILDYRKVAERTSCTYLTPIEINRMRQHAYMAYLESLNDRELFYSTQAYVPYASRRELVDRLYALKTKPSFFLPTVRRSINKATVMDTPVGDMSVVMVAYGTLKNYHCYELDELNRAFHAEGNAEAGELSVTPFYRFTKPHDPATTFAVADVECLRRLLVSLETDGQEREALSALRDKVVEGLNSLRHRSRTDLAILEMVRQFGEEDRKRVHDYLALTFETGMYMRRWRGPGHPYPLLEKDTKVDLNPEKKAQDGLLHMRAFLEACPAQVQRVLTNLAASEYYRDRVEQSGGTLQTAYQYVASGEGCIRLASSKFVGTAAHYMKAIFRREFSNFNPQMVDRIA